MNAAELTKALGGHWHGAYGTARCPAHDDHSPSLAIKFCDDGRILLHCFAGCETEDVLSAIGLSFSDVKPERIGAKHNYQPKRIHARQAQKILRSEVLLVAIAAENIAEEIALSDEDRERVFDAACRIRSAMDATL